MIVHLFEIDTVNFNKTKWTLFEIVLFEGEHVSIAIF